MRRLLQLLRLEKMPTSKLPTLPPELVLLIAEHLMPSLQDLNSLLQTTRGLYILLSPVLVRWSSSGPNHHRWVRIAAPRGNTRLLRQLLLGTGDVVDSSEPDNGTTVLHAAVMLQRVDSVAVLLAHGAAIEAADRSGWTALHWAAWSGDCRIARLLLANGAKTTGSALHVAAMNGYLGMASLLMDHGADWELKDRAGVSAVEHAVAAGQFRVARLMGVNGDGGMNVARRREIVGRQERAITSWAGLVLLEELNARSVREQRQARRSCLGWALLFLLFL
ncbi:actin- protein 3 [Maublancomyces gigas]|uniref:Actin- protein 3 n=1 Tax=Discina gigas TaxID=1032678 RepID=A0ABR3G4A0_9PEZI